MSYDAGSITVLEGLEAVRKRPGMYIGSTGERGLHHLVYEVVDNAVDEALAGFCDRIDVTLLPDGGVRVADNGRGIPVDDHPVEHRPAVEVVLTTLHAGGKFDGKSYAVSGGLHGVGVSVVNALSSRLEVEIQRDDYEWRQSYQLGDPVTELARGRATAETGTTITFWPDEHIFETTEWSFETLSRRLQEMAFLNRGLAIALTDLRPGHINGEPRVIRYCYAGGIADFVRYLNGTKEPVHASVIEFGEEGAGIAVEIAMQWNSSYTESVYTFANTINTAEGGTHEDGFRAALTTIVNTLRPRAEAGPGQGRARCPARTCGRAWPRSSRSSWPTPSSRGRPRPSSATLRPSRSCRRCATTTCGTGSSATRARPRTSSARPPRRRGPGSPPARPGT